MTAITQLHMSGYSHTRELLAKYPLKKGDTVPGKHVAKMTYEVADARTAVGYASET